jgi:hypothetical protein
MKLKRKKIGDRSYLLVDTKTGEVIAHAAQTGEHGRDNYPWDWYLADGVEFAQQKYPNGASIRTGGAAEFLKDIVDNVESTANYYGLIIKEKP